MSNGTQNLNIYFPSGAKANIIKNEISIQIENGNLARKDRVITLDQLKEIKDEQRKKFWEGQAITIITGIILWIISKFIGV
jgi:hypothetical protein